MSQKVQKIEAAYHKRMIPLLDGEVSQLPMKLRQAEFTIRQRPTPAVVKRGKAARAPKRLVAPSSPPRTRGRAKAEAAKENTKPAVAAPKVQPAVEPTKATNAKAAKRVIAPLPRRQTRSKTKAEAAEMKAEEEKRKAEVEKRAELMAKKAKVVVVVPEDREPSTLVLEDLKLTGLPLKHLRVSKALAKRFEN